MLIGLALRRGRDRRALPHLRLRLAAPAGREPGHRAGAGAGGGRSPGGWWGRPRGGWPASPCGAWAPPSGAPRAGAAGALLLASHPLWLANSRRAGLDAPALALGLLAALLAVWALRPRAPHVAQAPGAPGAARRRGRRCCPCSWRGPRPGSPLGRSTWPSWPSPRPSSPSPAAVRARLRPGPHRAPGRRPALPAGGGNRLLGHQPGPLPRSHRAGSASAWTSSPPRRRDMRWRLPRLPVPGPGGGGGDRPRGVAPGLPGRRGPDPPRAPQPGLVRDAGGGPGRPGRPAGPGPPGPRSPGPGSRLPHLAAAVWTGVVYLALVWSVPIWWERWHLPLVLPLCLLAGLGLAWLGRGSLALTLLPGRGAAPRGPRHGPVLPGKGIRRPAGDAPRARRLQVLALTAAPCTLPAHVSVRQSERARPARVRTASCGSGSSAPGGSRRGPTSPATRPQRGWSCTPPAT